MVQALPFLREIRLNLLHRKAFLSLNFRERPGEGQTNSADNSRRRAAVHGLALAQISGLPPRSDGRR